MQLRYNFRLYPTPGQRQELAKAFGCARVVFNDALRARREAHAAGLPYIKDTDLQKQIVTAAKRTEERAWLGEVSSVVLVQALADLHTAYRNFFASVTGSRKGPKVAAPRFRSRKDNRHTIRLTRNGFSIRPNGRLYVAKVGEIPVRWSRELPSDPSSVTIVKDAAGRYFASFVVRTHPTAVLPETTSEIGIDLGLTHFAILSDGRKVSSPKFLRRAERKLRKAQQALSRKAKGSNNRKRAVAKVARLHARVADARRDHHHKLSTTLIRENQVVYVEDLSVKGLARTRLAKSVLDAGWARFTAMLGVQGRPVRADLRQGRPLDPVHADLLCVLRRRRAEAPRRPGVDVRRMPNHPRPGRERGPNRLGRRTGGQAKRLRRMSKPLRSTEGIAR